MDRPQPGLASRKVAIFARPALLEGIERGAWFPATPLSRVLVFSGRVNCPPGEQAPAFDAPAAAWRVHGAIPYAWFVWEHAYTGEPTLGFLGPCRRQGNRLVLEA